jgi:hypothetical protein
MNRDEMMEWIEGQLPSHAMVRTSEQFNGMKNGIWMSGEDCDVTYKGEEIYSYYSGDHENRTFGVLNSWEKELNDRGWYSEWYDAGTIGIWRIR